jgi:hypothetical protein
LPIRHVSEIVSLPLRIRYRLKKAEVHRPDGFDPRRHTAQFVFYLTVQNRNRQSGGFGDYYWFGVPLYDARYRLMAMNTGWEVTGPLDVEVELAELRLSVVTTENTERDK